VHAAMVGRSVGLADNWLRHVQDVRAKHDAELGAIADDVARARRLCELNVREQVRNVCESTVLRDAWARSQPVSVHGWVYGIDDGRLRDLGCTQSEPA